MVGRGHGWGGRKVRKEKYGGRRRRRGLLCIPPFLHPSYILPLSKAVGYGGVGDGIRVGQVAREGKPGWRGKEKVL